MLLWELSCRRRLNGVDEEFLLAVEEKDAEQEQDKDDEGAVGQGYPGELTGTEGTDLEGLDDSGHGIPEHERVQKSAP